MFPLRLCCVLDLAMFYISVRIHSHGSNTTRNSGEFLRYVYLLVIRFLETPDFPMFSISRKLWNSDVSDFWKLLGSNLGPILSFCVVFYVSTRTLFLFGLRYVLCFLQTPWLSGYVSYEFVDICFMFYLSLLPYVSLARTMSSLSLSRTPQFPLDPILLSLLSLLSSRTHLPLRCIRSLVYISCVLVL